jgi:hypothetical protein
LPFRVLATTNTLALPGLPPRSPPHHILGNNRRRAPSRALCRAAVHGVAVAAAASGAVAAIFSRFAQGSAAVRAQACARPLQLVAQPLREIALLSVPPILLRVCQALEGVENRLRRQPRPAPGLAATFE